jgi:hypothetical protein
MNYNQSTTQYGTIKRSNSRVEDRPSTAPQKDDKREDRTLQGHSSLKRLPSPAVKSMGMNGSSKNLPQPGKYRSPSPYTSSNLNINRSNVTSSIKGGKPTWK